MWGSAGHRAPVTRARRAPWRVALWLVLFVAAVAVLIAALTSSGGTGNALSHPHQPKSTEPASATSTTTTDVTTTTTAAALPAAPQASALAAAGALISSWADGNQARALSVATPQAVSALFAATYQSGLVTDRGCNSASSVVTCSYGPYGGASPTDPLYSLTVQQEPSGGWYVSAVVVEG